VRGWAYRAPNLRSPSRDDSDSRERGERAAHDDSAVSTWRAGIEKITPRYNDLSLFLTPGEERDGTEVRRTFHSSCPKRKTDKTDPEEFHLVLLDTLTLGDTRERQRESLYCIRCGRVSTTVPFTERWEGTVRVGLFGPDRRDNKPSADRQGA
jgi:hypothetical protein